MSDRDVEELARLEEEIEQLWRELKHGLKSESVSSIRAMIHLARGDSRIDGDHEQFDANPELLNVPNGTIDLRTGLLRAHDPADLITKQCPIDYDAAATASLWEKCQKEWQPDSEIRRYLQILVGACATGHATQTLDVHYGDGANGKSVFWGVIMRVLGDDYAVVPHKSLLVKARHEQHATVKASLFRVRLALASETSAGDHLDEEQVKALTGNDRIAARRMREDEWSFWPTHTLVMVTNHRLTVRGNDEAIWRRVRMVEWPVTILPGDRDPELAERLWVESAGILRWIVEGARMFLEGGLEPPKSVRVATEAYRRDEDVVGRFVDDVLRFDSESAHTLAQRLVIALEPWCEAQGIEVPPRPMNELAGRLRQRGCENVGQRTIDNVRGVAWRGVRVARP
jgi:putative DNA primase/helicase